MSVITVVKDNANKLIGFRDTDKKAYARFRKILDDLTPGELFQLEYWFPRNATFHKKHFVMLHDIFDAQDRFVDFEPFRDWMTIGAGHAIFVPGPNGETIALADSIAYKRLDDVAFEAHHEKVKDFLRTAHAQSFLWEHLDAQRAGEMVEALLDEFGGGRWQ